MNPAPARLPSPGRQNLLAATVLALLALLAEGLNIFRVGFWSDDLILLAWYDQGIAGAFNPRFWPHRPLGLTFQWLLHRLFGFSAPAHQAAIILVQILVAFLFYRLLAVVSRGRSLWALLTAALFLVYPLDETVPWPSFAPQRLALALWLAGTLLLVSEPARFLGVVRGVAFVALAAAVATNEMFLPLTLASGLLVAIGSRFAPQRRVRWGVAAGTVVVVTAYLLWRFAVVPRLVPGVDWRAGEFVLDPRHWYHQMALGFRIPLYTVWTFRSSPDPFAFATQGRLVTFALAAVVTLLVVSAVLVFARSAKWRREIAFAARAVAAGLALMGVAMTPFVPTKSDLGLASLTATRNHYSIDVGASLVVMSEVLLISALVSGFLRLRPGASTALFGLLAVPTLLLGVWTHRRVGRDFGELTAVERQLACEISAAAPSFAPGSYVLLTGIPVFHLSPQPLDAQWAVMGLLQLLYEDPSLGGTPWVEEAIVPEVRGPLANLTPQSPAAARVLSNLVVLRQTGRGFEQTRELPSSLVQRGYPRSIEVGDRIRSETKRSRFFEQYLGGCPSNDHRSPVLAAGIRGACIGDGVTTGFYEPATGQFVLLAANASGATATTATLGLSGGRPIAGDWFGRGRDSIGVFRRGRFILVDRAEHPSRRLEFRFGQEADLPLAGDWNGDGSDEVGVFRDGTFLLAGSRDGSRVLRTFRFGLRGDLPLAGDWNGDGVDEVGVFRPSEAAFLLASPDGTSTVASFTFGLQGDLPIAGDWNGDGIDNVAVLRGGTVFFRCWNSTDFADREIVVPSTGLPVAGDWDGDSGGRTKASRREPE